MSKIDHPEYYKAGGIEAIDVIEDWKLDFCLGNAIKYIARAGKKSNDVRTDLEKAAWYIKRHWDGVKNGHIKPIEAQTHTKYHVEDVCEAWGITDDILIFVMEILYLLVVPNKEDDSTYESNVELAYAQLNYCIKYNLEPWKPKNGDLYYTPDFCCEKMFMTRKWTNHPRDEDTYAKGLAFKTWGEARDMCVKMMEFAREEHNK